MRNLIQRLLGKEDVKVEVPAEMPGVRRDFIDVVKVGSLPLTEKSGPFYSIMHDSPYPGGSYSPLSTVGVVKLKSGRYEVIASFEGYESQRQVLGKRNSLDRAYDLANRAVTFIFDELERRATTPPIETERTIVEGFR